MAIVIANPIDRRPSMRKSISGIGDMIPITLISLKPKRFDPADRNRCNRYHVLSGRRPLSRGLLRLGERLGCGHVFGLCVRERFAPAGCNDVRFGSSPHHRTALVPAQPEGRRPHPITVMPVRYGIAVSAALKLLDKILRVM